MYRQVNILILIMFPLLISVSCGLKFSHPILKDSGDSVKKYPEYFEGIFKCPINKLILQTRDSSSNYYTTGFLISKIVNNKVWKVSLKYGIPIDSLKSKTFIDRSYYNIKKEKEKLFLIPKDGSSINIKEYVLNKKINIYLDSESQIEVDLNIYTKRARFSGVFLNDNGRFALNKIDDKYLLNLHYEYWFPFIFIIEKDMNVSLWFLANNEFLDDIKFFRPFLSDIKDLSSEMFDSYLLTATDKEVNYLFDQGRLFSNETLIRIYPIDNPFNKQNLILISGIVILIIVLFIYSKKINKIRNSKQLRNSKNIFLSYSHKDEQYKLKLISHLAPLIRSGKITVWDDSKIKAGAKWKDEILNQLRSSEIILILVSADFIHSDFCFSTEIQEALKIRDSGKGILVPVIIKPCLWEETFFGNLHVIPKNGKALSTWKNENDAFVEVVKELYKLL